MTRWSTLSRSRRASSVGPRPYRSRRRAVRWGVLSLVMAIAIVLAWWAVVSWRAKQLVAYREGAYQARRTKQWDQVSDLAGRWAKREPDAALPVLMLAEAAQEKGDLQQASDYLGGLPPGDPRTVRGLLERTNLLFGPLNQPFEGAETCKRIIRLEPANVEAWQRLTFFYAVTVQRVALARATRQAIRQGADTPETYIYLVGADWMNLANGFDVATRWLQANADNETLLVARAMNYIYSTNVHEEILAKEGGSVDSSSVEEKRPYHEQVLAEYFERFPKNCELLDYYLKQAATKGDAQRVAELLSQAPPESAEDSRFWRHQGWLLASQGKPHEAEKAFQKALERNTLDWRALHQMSGVVRQSGHIEEAKELARRAAEGKRLEKVIYELPNVKAVSPKVLTEIAIYLEQCGEDELAARLRTRLPPEEAPLTKD